MRSRTTLAGLLFLVWLSPPAPAAQPELERHVGETFNENCSAVQLKLITMRIPPEQNVDLLKGQRSKYIPLDHFGSAPSLGQHQPLHGEMEWFCGDTKEASECDSEATHVRVKRASTGRATTFTCYRIESCSPGSTLLDKLDDRCGEETLRVGGKRIDWRSTVENIPFSAARLNDSGGVRWYCGDSAERSNCPAGTTLLTIERKDRDTRLFHIHCLRAGAQCEAYDGPYPPN